MKTAVRFVKMKACINATNTSIKYMNVAKAIETGEKPQPIPVLIFAKMKISETKQIMMMWPASILAKRRMINAKGLVKMERISTGIIINFTKPGTGGQKICFQWCLLALTKITTKEITPRTTVKAI